eukprot:gene27317-33650_t
MSLFLEHDSTQNEIAVENASVYLGVESAHPIILNVLLNKKVRDNPDYKTCCILGTLNVHFAGKQSISPSADEYVYWPVVANVKEGKLEVPPGGLDILHEGTMERLNYIVQASNSCRIDALSVDGCDRAMHLALQKQILEENNSYRKLFELRYSTSKFRVNTRPERVATEAHRVFERTPAEVTTERKEYPHVLYAIVGKSYTYPNYFRYAYFVHVWGVDLSSRNTPDYATYVRDEVLQTALYTKRY